MFANPFQGFPEVGKEISTETTWGFLISPSKFPGHNIFN